MARLKGGADYGKSKDPSNRGQIERFSPEGVFMALYPWLRDGVCYVEDDFAEDTISATRWNVSNTAGGDGTSFAWTAARSGTVQGTTGATDDHAISINGDALWYGDANCGMEIRFKIDVVTGFSFEIGFTDALTDEDLPAVTDIDTPATGNGATDVAVIHLDTDQTLTTAAFVGESTGVPYAAQKVNLGTWTPSAGVWYKARVQLETDVGYCKIFKDTVPSQPILEVDTDKGLPALLDGTTAVRPHMLFRTRNTTPKVVDIDYVRIWQDR